MTGEQRPNSRLERILLKLADEHSPVLKNKVWLERDEYVRIRMLARGLASAGIVVIAGRVPAEYQRDRSRIISKWVKLYREFYYLLTRQLFPKMPELHEFDAHFADQQDPPIVTLHGRATFVWHQVAGCINPYLESRQRDQSARQAELLGVISLVLDALETSNLKLQIRNDIQMNGIRILRELLELPIYHISLTEFDDSVRPVLQIAKPRRPIAPPPSRPAGLPEQSRRTDTVAQTPPQNNHQHQPEPEPEDSDFLALDILEEKEQTNTTQLFRDNVDMNSKTGILPPLPPIRPRKNEDK